MATQDDMVADHLRMWHRFCRIMTLAVVGTVVVLAVLGLTLL